MVEENEMRSCVPFLKKYLQTNFTPFRLLLNTYKPPFIANSAVENAHATSRIITWKKK